MSQFLMIAKSKNAIIDSVPIHHWLDVFEHPIKWQEICVMSQFLSDERKNAIN
jgi:hypothetical protein